jgi:hypothetical protein
MNVRQMGSKIHSFLAGPSAQPFFVLTVSLRYCFLSAIALVLIAASPQTAFAQRVVAGTVIDAADRSPMPGVNVVATQLSADSTRVGVATASDGSFSLRVAPGRHQLRVTFVGYITEERTITVADDTLRLGSIALMPDVLFLDETIVEAVQERVVVRGDTTVYNADAYTVHRDASAEDLVRRMPGVVVQDGQVQAQGEQVRRVLVDGEEFFGNDATAALRNLPAEMIQEIEIFDRGTDQARFTGFQDGNEERTMNIVTRPGMRQGQFGRIYGGFGTDNRYNGGGAINIFNGTRRISLIGLTNNVNQQNFAFEDLMGVLGDGGGRGGGRGGMTMRGGGGGWMMRGGGGGGMSGNPRDYMIGEQSGLNTTNSVGINYTDRWGRSIRVNSSYFVNRSGNDTDAWLEREYLASADEQFYSEATNSEAVNINHRFNARIEADLSESTQLVITPRASVQISDSESFVLGSNMFGGGSYALQGFNNQTEARNRGYDASSNFLVRHRFATEGRTLSVNVGLNADSRDASRAQLVDQFWEGDIAPGDELENDFSREILSDGVGRRISGNIAFTERLGEVGFLQLNYRPAFSVNRSDQDAFRYDPVTGGFTMFDPEFTSESRRESLTNRGGLSYRIRTESFNISLGGDIQLEQLNFEQTGGRPFTVDRSYWSFLPTASFQYNIAQGRNLSLNYRSNTNTPSANQLRDVIDDSNPLFITTGNPALDPSTSHNLFLRYRSASPQQGTMFMSFLSAGFTQNYVANAVVQAGRDSVRVQGITLEPGARFSYPVNLEGQFSARSFIAYGRPVGFLRSNLNASIGGSYASIPGMTNGIETRSENTRVDGRIFLGSNISPNVDFSLSYLMSYSHAANASSMIASTDSYRHRGSLGTTLRPWGPLLLETNVAVNHYTNLAESVDPTSVIWNAAVGYKFLQNERAEIRFGVVDLLNQNTNVDRSITDLYIEDFESRALGRYFMVNLIYQVRHFGSRR